jgi:hypothetical protein
MSKNKLLKYFKYIIIIISFIFLYSKSVENFKYVLNSLILDYQLISLSILTIIIIQNLLVIRSFNFLKLTSKYNANITQWGCLFFLTGLINQSPFWGTGHIIRSFEMKKNNYSHKEYFNMYLFIFFWNILIYSIFLILSSFFFNKINFYTLFLLLILFLFSFIATNVKTLKLSFKIFERFIHYRFIKKIKFSSFFLKQLLKMLESALLITKLKVFKLFFLITLLMIIFEYFLLSLIFKFLFQNFNFEIIFLFFLLNFLIKSVKPIDNLIGIKETILGLYGQQLGLLFLEGAIIGLILRLLGTLSLILNYILYYLLNKNFKKQNL